MVMMRVRDAESRLDHDGEEGRHQVTQLGWDSDTRGTATVAHSLRRDGPESSHTLTRAATTRLL